MDPDQFTIFLPSNSSMNYFPENTTTNYSTKLPKEIELHGKWSVGLSEIHIPCTTLHLSKEDTNISADKEIYFQHGVYDSIHQLVDVINEALLKIYNGKAVEKMFYDEKGGFVSIQSFMNSTQEPGALISDKVKRILGFDTGGFLTHPSSENNSVALIGNQPASLARAVPDQLFVYSNLCEPYIVGDSHASLLRIVNLSYKKFNFGSSIVKHFAPVNYVPLLYNKFQIIDIDIRDQYGKSIPFEFGTLTVALHFKREY